MKTTARAGMGTLARFLLLFSALFAITLYGSGLRAASVDEELMSKAKAIFGPLPSSMPSEANPITPEKVKLGNALFWQTRISADGTVSCVRCHPIGLYAADGLKKPIGNRCNDLTKEQANDIVAFLGALTGTIPEAAARVPLLPPSE